MSPRRLNQELRISHTLYGICQKREDIQGPGQSLAQGLGFNGLRGQSSGYVAGKEYGVQSFSSKSKCRT